MSATLHNSLELPIEASPRGRPAWRSPELLVPGVILTLIVCACFVVPLVYPLHAPVGGNVLDSRLPLFSPGHFLGTDLNGNDVLSRLLHGGRASLLIALSVNAIGLVLGASLGATGAYLGGVADSLVMRVLDVFIAFPALVLVLVIAQAIGPGESHTVMALAFFSVPAYGRIARAATLRLRERPFILAAVRSGTGTVRILLRHIAPNILPQLTTFALLGMGTVIVVEGALSFLGLGVRAPAPSWGTMIAHGQHAMSSNAALLLLPSGLLFVTVLSFNLLGEGLRARWSKR